MNRLPRRFVRLDGYPRDTMADKKSTEKKIRTSAAEATVAADKIPSLAVGTREARPPAESMKQGKLVAKNKHRLPRWQKKAQQKAADHL
jgi:hypothetical protein